MGVTFVRFDARYFLAHIGRKITAHVIFVRDGLCRFLFFGIGILYRLHKRVSFCINVCYIGRHQIKSSTVHHHFVVEIGEPEEQFGVTVWKVIFHGCVNFYNYEIRTNI